jgi:hypothetical protein
VIELCVKELRGKALYVKELCERVGRERVVRVWQSCLW